jgi:flavin reductase (DIM6/NTAB) family NADH-FMN oxidoreductase RutF
MVAESAGVLRQRFLAAMSHAPCTVNVVTTDGPGGRSGVTVSAMSSVSADAEKPLLLICVNAASASARPIIENGVFCVNVLRDSQAYIADCFAGRIKTADGNKFSCAPWTTLKTGAPRLLDPLVAFDCRLVSGEQVGTHFVFIGAVEDIHHDGPGSALVYANRTYATAMRFVTSGGLCMDAPEVLKIGAFHTFAPCVVPEILERLIASGQNCKCRLIEGDQRHLVEGLRCGDIDIGLIYDWDLGPDIVLERMAAQRPYVLVAEGDPLACRKALSLSELATQPLVLLSASPSADFFLSMFQDRGLNPNIRLRSGSFEMVRGLVARGLGYSILVTMPAHSMSYDGRPLVSRPIRDVISPTYLSVAYRKHWRPSPSAEALLIACRNVLQPGQKPQTSRVRDH